ncbi:hypothetical protein ACULNC_17325 [Shigella flexneri]
MFDSGELRVSYQISQRHRRCFPWLAERPGKTIASKDVMTRTENQRRGRPYLAEEGTETVGVTGLTVAPASVSVKAEQPPH